jgi:hypothetical protein
MRFAAVDPAAPFDDLLPEIPDVDNGSAESCHTQLEEGQQNFGRRSFTHT